MCPFSIPENGCYRFRDVHPEGCYTIGSHIKMTHNLNARLLTFTGRQDNPAPKAKYWWAIFPIFRRVQRGPILGDAVFSVRWLQGKPWLENESTQGEQHNVETEATTTDEAARPRGTVATLSPAWQTKTGQRSLEVAASQAAMGVDQRSLEWLKETIGPP